MTEPRREAAAPDLERALRALAAADRHMRVPSHVHANVMRAWDSTMARGPRPRAGRLAWTVSIGVVSAAAALVIAVAVSRERPAGEPAHVATATAIPRREAAPASTQPGGEAPVAAQPVLQRRRGRTPMVRSSRMGPGIVLVADPLPDASTLRVVRVRVPRAALVQFGIPIADPDAAGTVDLEVLVGEDGIARTIRRAVPVIAFAQE